MNRDADNLVDVQWLARCANRLRQQWPRADVAAIDEAAQELWSAEWLREMPARKPLLFGLSPCNQIANAASRPCRP